MNKEAYRLFDAHLHLQDARLRHCVGAVLAEAKQQGVEGFACNGCCEADWDEVQRISEVHPEVIPNFGLHPWWVGRRSKDWLATLRSKLEAVPSAGLGECGLDRGKRCSDVPLDEQAEVMCAQLQLAKELNRPVSIHCVRAFGKLQECLEREGPFPAGIVLHSWAGSASLVPLLARIPGVYFSLSGHTLQLSQKKLEAMLNMVPLERLLLETDAPDALPDGPNLMQIPITKQLAEHQVTPEAGGKVNHPANIRAVLEIVARVMEKDTAIVAQAAFQNATRVFLKR